MESESNIVDDASAMRSTTPDDKYSLSAKLDGIPNQCETAEAEDEVKGDKTTKITITSIRTQEDKNSSESSSPDKPSIETANESSYCQDDKILNQPLKQISENETEYETGITSKDIEIGGHKIEAINDTNIEEYDLDIENEEVSNLACAGEQNLEVHEQEPSSDNSDSSHDKHASIEVISDSTEKQKITSQTNENTIPKEKDDADLQHIEQATIISEANLGLNNEVLIPNIELETENLYKDDERVTESGVKDEDKDNKCTSHSITHVEDENKDTSLIGVQNKTEGISYVEEGEWKALDSISFSNNLVYDNDNNREDISVQGKTEDSSKASQDTGINLSNDAEEQENVPALYTGEKSDIEDGSQIIQEEAKEIEPETGRQLQETAAKGVPEQEAQSTVFTLAIVEDGTIEKTIQEKTHKEEESTTIDGDKSYTPENEHEQAAKVLEEIDLLKTMSKVSAENEEHADQKSEAQSSENMTTKHIDSDEMEKTESILKSSYDIIEQEQTPELLSDEHREINDGGKIITEEAIGVLEVQTIHPPPTIESAIVESSDKSIQEEIHNDAESAVTDTEHGQTRANEFDDKTNVLEAFELHEVNGSTSEENEKNVEPQSEASLDTIAFKHPDLQRLESTEINLSNDTEEQENVTPSGTGEKSEIKDGPQIIQEEAKEIELATEKLLPVTAIESIPEEDAPSIAATATLALVQSGITEKTIQEPILIDDEKSCTKENEHDQATKVLEVINLPETMSKVSVESVEHADQKSEAQRSESVITKHVGSEEMVKMESIEKESHDVKEVEKSLELPSDEHQEINDGGKILPEEVLGVPEDKNLQSLPVIASTIVESADKSIQEEINKDVELAITYTEEGPRTEIEFEERTDVLEPRVDNKETENLQAPDIGEKLEVKDGNEILQGEAKEMEQETKKQFPEAGIESVPEQEAPSTVLTLAIVEDGTIEKTIQEKTYKEEESTTIDEDKSYTPENEHEQAAKILEEIDLLKTTTKVRAENEEHADQKSEAQSSENMTTKHIDSDEMETTESILKSSYDIIEQEQTPELPFAENWDINDGEKIITEKATGVPEVQTIQPPPTIESVIVETFDKSIQEEIDKDAKSAVTDTEEEQTGANDFEDKTNVLEASELHEVNGSTFEENEKNAEPQSEASLDTIALKHPNLQRLESTEINPSNDTEEQENVQPSGTGEKSEIKDGPQILQEEAKEVELATEKQLAVTAIESVPEDKTLQSLPVIASTIVESADKSIQEEIHKDVELITDTEEGPRAEIEFEERNDVLEVRVDHKETENLQAPDIGEKLEVKDGDEILQGEAKEMEQETKKQLPEAGIESVPEQEALSTVPTLAIVEDGTTEKSIQEKTHKEEESTKIDDDKSCTPENEHEQAAKVLEAIDLLKTTSMVSAENEEHADQKSEAQSSENMINKHIDSDEMEKTESTQKSSYDIIEQEQSPELPSAENREINDGGKIILEEATGVPEVQTIHPPPTIESVIVETFHKNIEEEIHKDAESAVTDTKEGQTRANEFDDKTNVPEAINLPETKSKVSAESVEHADQKSEAQRSESVITRHVDSEEMVKMENIEKESHDVKEVEASPELPAVEHQEINDGGKIIPEEVLGVPEDQTLQSLPVIASIRDENADESIQEEIHKDVESAITDTEEEPTAHIEYQERINVLEAFDIHEVIARTGEENEKKAEQQFEVNQNTAILKQLDLEGLETKIVNMSNDTVETENLQVPDIGEKLEVKDGDEILQEEAKEMEQGTKKQLPEAGIESVPEQEALSTIPKLVTVEGGTVEKTIQEQTHEEKEPTLIDDNKSCTTENEHEKTTKVIEAIDLPETMSKVSTENEENADQKSKEQSSDGENWITNPIDLEEIVATESTEKSSFDVKELKRTLELPSAENQDIDDGGKIMPEEAIGVSDGQTLQSLPPLASIGVQNVDRSIQEGIHIDGESAVTDTEEGKTHENEFEDKTNSLEALELHEVIANTNMENEKEVEPQSAVSLETTVSIHPNFEGLEKTEINQSNDTEEQENVPESNTREKLEIKDGPEIIQEETREKELATEIQLPETVTESVDEQEAPSTVTPLEIVEGGIVEETIQEQIHEEDQPKLIHEQASNDLEAIGLPETMSKGSAENEELANNKSEAQSDENVITKHINSEETGTTEDIEKSSYDVKDLEKTLELPSAENREINDRGEIIQEEAIGVPEDQMLQPPPTIESVVVQTFDKSIQEEIHKDGKSAVTDTEEGQTSENEFEGKTNVLEAYDLHKVISSTTEENEKKAKPQSEMSLESTVLKHSNLEGLGTTELNPGNDTDELENFLASDTVEKSDQELPSVENREIKESVEITPVEAIGVPADQTLPSLPIIESIGVENVNYSMQEKVQGNSKLALSDTEEEQKQENEFEDKTNALQEFKMDELIAITCEENDKKAEPESEASIDTTVLKHPDLELLETTEVNLNNETEEQENVLASDTGKKLEIKDGPQIIDDEAKEIELATENQLPESATETIVEGGTVEKTSLEKTQEEEESKPIDDDKNYSPENEYEQATKVVEAIDVPKTTSKANAENEENAIQKSDEQSIENVNAKHVNSEEMVTLENIEKSSYDVKEVEMTPELPSADSQEINDSRKILLGEALGVPRDQTLQPLPSIAFDGVKTGDKSIQEQIHTHGESTVVNTEEGQTHQIEFEDKTKVLEAFDLLDENACTSKENREKAELQSDASTDNIVLKHLNLEALETTKLNPSIDTDEPKNVSAPDTGEELEIKDYSHIIQEEAKGVELATEMQLLDAVTESVPEQEAQSTVSPLAIDEGGTIEKINQEQTHEEEESTPVDEDKSCARENENEQATEVLEAIGLSETMSKASVENEEHDDQKSEAQSIEYLTTKHIESGEMTTKEKIEISSYDVHDLERTPELPSSENEEINEGGTNTLEEEIGVPEDQTLQPLPTAESGVVETVDKSIEEEIHKDGKSTVTDTEEGLNHENEPVENVLEESNLHEVVAITNNEIEKKVESQSESILNTTALKHTSLEGLETIEINPGIETEEPENVPVSDTGKKLEMDGGAKIIQEEENVMELTTEKQLPEASTASINEQEDLSTPVIVEGGTLEKLIQEHAHEEEESTPIDDNKNNTPDNKHEEESVVDEEIDLPKTMSTFSAENEEHADHKSEAQCSNVIARHIDSEDMVTKECIEKSTHDVKLLDKTHELPSSENQEINDSEKITPQEAIGVSDNESLQSPPTIACRGVEIVDKNIQKETHKDNESAVTETEEEHRHENEYDGKTNVLEAFDLHEVIASTNEENGEKSEPQLEVNLDTIVLKHLTDPSFEGLETTEINKSIDTEKPENVSASNTGEKLEIKDGSEIIQEKAKEMELANEIFLPETTTKSVPEQEAPSTTSTSATPGVGTLEKIIQEQTNEEEESTLEDEQENETRVLEVIGLPETMSKISAENEEHAEQKTESQSSVNTITKHIDSEETITTESIEKSNDIKELQNTSGVPQDQTLQPLTTIAYVGVESIDRSIQEEIHKDDESTVTNSREEKTHENKFEDKMKVLEGFGLHEIIPSTSDENENKAESEPEPEASLNSNVIKHHDLEELETIEINSSNDTEEPENVLASDIGENLEIKDGAEIILVEAKKIELATEKQLLETATGSVAEQKATSTMLTPEIVQGGTVDKTIQEQTREEDESTPIDDEKSCNPENEVHEESNLDKATGNEKKSNPQSDEHNLETTVIQQPNLEGHETTEIGSSSDIEECEKFPLIQTEQISEIKDGGKIILEEEEKEMEDATDKQLPKSSEQSVLEDEAQTVLVPTSEFVEGETIEKSFQEETLKEEQSTAIDNDKSRRPENELEQTTEVLEPGECIAGRNFQAEAQRETSIPGTNLVSLNQIEDVDLPDVRKFESGENFATPNEDFSSSTTIDASEGPQRDESKNTLYSSSSLIPREVEKEDKAESFNRADIENIFDKNDARTNENIEEQTIDYENSLVEAKISLPIEGIVDQVKDHDVENFEATDSIEQRDIKDLSFENDPARKEAAPRDSDKVIESEAIEKLEIRELETDQIGSAKGGEGEDEFEKISPSSSDIVMIKDSQDSDVKVSPKKHHGILSGVGSKVKHSISKVKKAITGKSSHSKTSSEK